MCGIVAAFHTGKGAKPVNEWALKTFEDQHSRGVQGFGIVGWKPGQKPCVLRSCESAKFMFDIHAKTFPMMLLHHRAPTSTPNKMDQTHPIFVSHASLAFDYLVIHNGVIYNDKELYKEHADLGFAYTTEIVVDKEKNIVKINDSESIAIELARFIENQTTKIGARGSAALVALQIDKRTGKPTKIFFCRNTNPLKMGKSRNKLHLSSEGEGALIEPNTLYSFVPTGEMDLDKRAVSFAEYKYTPTPSVSNYIPAKTEATHVATTYVPNTAGNSYPIKSIVPQKTTIRDVGDMTDEEFSKAIRGEEDPDEAPIPNTIQDILSDTAASVDDAVSDCLDLMCDADSIYFANIESTVRKVRGILEAAKMQLQSALMEEAEDLAKIDAYANNVPHGS